MGFGKFLETVGLATPTGEALTSDQLASLEAAHGEGVQAVELPSGFSVDGLVTTQEIYEKFELSDFSRSVFKAEELKNQIPDAIQKELRRTTLIGILTATNLSTDEVKLDAQKRMEALNATMLACTEDVNQCVAESQSEIKELETKIDLLKQFINDKMKQQEEQSRLIIEEKQKIQATIDFIEGK